jgi:methylated-DNA-protein-cysteine methyltransferase related protein
MAWRDDVEAMVLTIPRGRVASYGDVAAALGHPLRARQVGTALSAMPVGRAGVVPWQRVVNARGFLSIRGAFAAKDVQRSLLRAEGVAVGEDFIVVDFAAVRWRFGPPSPSDPSVV